MATSTSEMAKQAATSGADKAKQAASSGGETAKGFGSTVVTTVKQNPWPAALTAVGIGWLFSSGGGAKGGGTTDSKAETAPPPPTYGAAGVDADAGGNAAERAKETTTQVVDQAQDAVGTALGRVSETTGEAVNKVAETAGGTVAKAAETATGAVETVGSVLGGTASKVKSGATGLVSGVQQRAHRVSDMAAESPLKVGGTTLAVGAVLGLALPVSRRETALIGAQRDNAIDRFEKTAQETLTKLQSVAQEAQEAAGKEAKYQGLAPETS